LGRFLLRSGPVGVAADAATLTDVVDVLDRVKARLDPFRTRCVFLTRATVAISPRLEQ
jgi:hypothetical protein